LHQGIESTVGQKLIEAAESEHDALLDLAIDPIVFHDEQVGAGTVGLRANEQEIARVSLLSTRFYTQRHNCLRMAQTACLRARLGMRFRAATVRERRRSHFLRRV